MLSPAEANLASLIECTSDLIWSVDSDDRLTLFNSTFRRHIEEAYGIQLALGMTPRQMAGAEWADLWPPRYAQARTQGALHFELALGDGRMLQLTLCAIAAGSLIPGVSVWAKDITEQKQLARSLAESETRLQGIFDNNGSVMLMVDPASGEIVRANAAASAFYGYPPGQLTAMKVDRINCLPPELVAADRQRALRGERHSFHFRHRLACGEEREVDVYSSPVEVQGRTLLFSVVHDVTERNRAEAALHQSLDSLQEAEAAGQVGSYVLDFRSGMWSSSQVLDEIFGIGPEYLRSVAGWEALVHPDDRAMMAAYFACEVIRDGKKFDKEYRIVRPRDGIVRWVHGKGRLQTDPQGNLLFMRGMILDITQQKLAERQLAISEERYRVAFQTCLDAININRFSDGMYLECNQAFLNTTGYTRDEIIGHSSLDLNIWADPQDRRKLIAELQRSSACSNLECQFRRKNGEAFWGIISASLIELEGERCILSFARDISEVREAARKIHDLAFYDSLTRLPNRHLLLERMGQTQSAGLRSDRKRALMLVDLDNFKLLNNTLGQDMGDQLLQVVARRLAACVRETDTIARLGSDEFVVMLEELKMNPEDAAAQAKYVAEKILAALAQPCVLGSYESHTSASIGIVVFSAQARNPLGILQQADIAMRQAKAAGRNGMHFFTPSLQFAVNARATIEQDIRHALSAQQFLLHYQPQVEEGALIGVEALIRWSHPRRGLVAPIEFIPLAEETGLILPIGQWVLEAACSQLASWAQHPETASINMAVNISAQQFRQHDFVEQVLGILDASGVSPQNLWLEITESMLMENLEEIIAKIAQLKSYGLRFSLDDFGTGYSSLSYLKRLPLDQLKIDRLFVRDILSDATRGAIAQSIISLARAMGLSVIAEGVETEAQRDFLIDLGCHAFQGYLFSRPLAEKDFLAWHTQFAGAASPLPQVI